MCPKVPICIFDNSHKEEARRCHEPKIRGFGLTREIQKACSEEVRQSEIKRMSNFLGELKWTEHYKQSTKLPWEGEPGTHTALKSGWLVQNLEVSLRGEEVRGVARYQLAMVRNTMKRQEKSCLCNSPSSGKARGRPCHCLLKGTPVVLRALLPSYASPSSCLPDTFVTWGGK